MTCIGPSVQRQINDLRAYNRDSTCTIYYLTTISKVNRVTTRQSFRISQLKVHFFVQQPASMPAALHGSPKPGAVAAAGSMRPPDTMRPSGSVRPSGSPAASSQSTDEAQIREDAYLAMVLQNQEFLQEISTDTDLMETLQRGNHRYRQEVGCSAFFFSSYA